MDFPRQLHLHGRCRFALRLAEATVNYHERLGELDFQVSGPSFFQVNTAQAERMIELVGRELALEPGQKLLDAYCGVGTFALSLGRGAGRVLGIESSTWSVGDALANADAAGVGDEFEFLDGDVAETLEELGETFDAVVLDPPRAAVRQRTVAALAGTCAGRIAYVSCDLAHPGRDAACSSSTATRSSRCSRWTCSRRPIPVETGVLFRKATEGMKK